MIPGIDHWYACVAEPTPGMLRWDVARNRCRDRHDLFRALGRITETMHMTTIKTAEGVAEAGPDEPALAAATQREENARAAAMQETVSGERAEMQWKGYRSRCVAEGIEPMSFEEWSRTITGERSKPWPGAPVGAVSREQAGILPTGPMRVTDDMVYRAQTVLMRAENPAGASAVRKALEAALQG